MTTLASGDVVAKNITFDWEGPLTGNPSIILEPEAPFPAYDILRPHHFYGSRRSAIGVSYITDDKDFVDARSWDIDIHQSGPCFWLEAPDGKRCRVIDEEMPLYSHVLNFHMELEGDDRLIPFVYRQRNNLTIYGEYSSDNLFIKVGRLKKILQEKAEKGIHIFLTSPIQQNVLDGLPLLATPSIDGNSIVQPPEHKAIQPQVILEKLV